MQHSVKYNAIKGKIYNLVEAEGSFDWFDYSVVTLILLNILAVGLETVHSLAVKFQTEFYVFEIFSIACFTIEYLLRIWACNHNPKYNLPFGRLKFAIRPIVIIDLLSVLPFFLHFKVVDLRHLQMFKIIRYSESIKHVVKIIKSQAKPLLSGVILISMLMIVSGSLLYYTEHTAQPTIFTSIPASLWWAIVTITTLGYGDMFPITILGRIFAALTAVTGIGLFALPAAIMGAAFIDHMKEQREKINPPKHCSNCGSKIGE